MSQKNLISFENVGLRYGLDPEILKNVNFKIQKGDFLLLGGESGSGKSSLLKLMNLSIFPSRGFVFLINKDIFALKANEIAKIRRKIGVIFQDFRLINHMTIFDNIALPLLVENIDIEEIKTRVYTILSWIGLERYAKMYPRVLSGGQQQCVSIARAIVKNPAVILADEPTGSIDSKMSFKILDMLEELNAQGVTVILASHSSEILNIGKYNLAIIENKTLSQVR